MRSTPHPNRTHAGFSAHPRGCVLCWIQKGGSGSIPEIFAAPARRTINRVSERKKDGVMQKTLTRLVENVTEESRVLERGMTQTVNRIKERPVEDKRIYSTHEPHVTCITRNKAGKKHEYGVKVSLSVDTNGFVVAHREYPDNRHDSTTLGDALEDWVKATGSLPKTLAAARGSRSKEERDINEWARIHSREKGLVAPEGLRRMTSHGEPEFARGDRVLFTRNDRNLDVMNGDFGTVRGTLSGLTGVVLRKNL